ncbi:enoyl-CoA hydratase/isomerase family protein [Chloroflexota bacterium]
MNQLSTEELLFNVENGVAFLTLNRPEKRNALTTSMFNDIPGILREVKSNDAIKVLVVTGSGDGFCSGADADDRLFARFVDGKYARLEKTRDSILTPGMVEVPNAFYNVDKPTIAAINGVTAGAGLAIAMLCDIRIASEKSRFAAAWLKVGLVPDLGGTYFLARTIGVDRALEFLYAGKVISAAEAHERRMVTRVVSQEELMPRVIEMAKTIASMPSMAVELTRRATYRAVESDLASQLEYENYAQELCFSTEDFREGVNAFLEKRTPNYKGI